MEFRYRLLKIFSGIISVASMLLVVILAGFKATYPIGYGNIIDENCKLYGLEKSLVQAVIKVESGYNCLSLSSAQAMGLMQIMPSTAKWIAGCLSLEEFKLEDLYKPEVNIQFGCFYLNYLTNKFENEHKVLFAYNAGEKTLIDYYSQTQPLVLEKIEIEETRQYISRVQKAKKVYKTYGKICDWWTN